MEQLRFCQPGAKSSSIRVVNTTPNIFHGIHEGQCLNLHDTQAVPRFHHEGTQPLAGSHHLTAGHLYQRDVIPCDGQVQLIQRYPLSLPPFNGLARQKRDGSSSE